MRTGPKHARLFFIVLLFFSPLVFADEVVFPAVKTPARKLSVGEKLEYTIRYLGIPVGKAVAEVKEITKLGEKPVYHITVQVTSHPVIDLVYKVRDTHHSFIDTERLHSLRYEKILNEGRYRADEVMTYNQEAHTAHYLSRKNGSEKEMDIPKDVQDQLSCGYWFRMQTIKPNTTVTVPVNADEKNWELEVKLHDVKKMKIKGIGEFGALEAEPLIKFQGIFVKRGKIRGWISMDERRIPLKMKVKVPILGSVVAELSAYTPGNVS